MVTRLAVLFLLSCSLAGSAQRPSHKMAGDGTRTLTGTVVDQDGHPIPQAAVQMENVKTLQVRSYISEAHGEFHFTELNTDVDYDLQAVFDNIRSSKKTLSQFDEHTHPTMTLVIHLPK